MYRSCLTLLFIFLFSHFTANAQLTRRIEFTGVSVDTVFPQQIQLTWEYLGFDTVIAIYRCKNNCNSDGTPWPLSDTTMVRMENTKLIYYDTANVNATIYYTVGWGGSGRSAPQNNMVLTAKQSVECDNAVSLSWTSWVKYVYYNDKDFDWTYHHNNERDTLDYYIFYRVKGSSGFILKDSIKGVHSTNIYPPDTMRCEVKLANNRLYEFVIQSISRSNGNSVFSNIDDSRIQNAYIPVRTSITGVNVENDQSIKIYVDIKNFPDPFEKLYLYRSTDELHYTRIDSIDFKKLTTNTHSFTDRDVKPNDSLYYYRVLPYTECFANDSSNIVTNIWLWGGRMPGEKYKDLIFFYREGIYNESYKLVRIVYGNTILVKDTILKYVQDTIDVLNFNDGVAMIYKIISTTTGCASNNTEPITHEPVLRFPNAFNPQSNVRENKTFYPIFIFPPDTMGYLFVIYNRLGQEVFSTYKLPDYDNYTYGCWDGTFQGKECPPGIYAFKISYTFNRRNGEIEFIRRYSDTGSFMLVR